MSASNQYTRSGVYDRPLRNSGPYEAIIVSHLDATYMGSLEVEILRYGGSGNLPQRSGELVTAKYLSPFYGVTPFAGLNINDGYHQTQKSYGFWMVPPDPGSRVLVIFAEGNPANAYWIGCVQDAYMNFMIPDGRASTDNTTAGTPDNLKGTKLPVGEYSKVIETGSLVDPTLFPKPYNKDFTDILEVEGLLYDEVRGLTTSSARREIPSAVFGFNTPGPLDKRQTHPNTEYGPEDAKVFVPFNRLGGSSLVMDDGDDKFIRATHPADGPPLYMNKELGDDGGDETIPQNECVRLRTRTGHQILLHNSEDLIYISNARGTAWIEITSDGKIDIHAQDSISVMSEQDINLSAFRDINMEAGRNVNMKASARWSDGQAQKNGIRSGQVSIESMFDSNIEAGRSTNFNTKEAFNINTQSEIRLTTSKDIHISTDAHMYQTVGGSMHQAAGQNWFRKAGADMIDDAKNLFTQIGENINITAGVDVKESVGANKDVTVGADHKVSITGNSHQTSKTQYTLASSGMYTESGSGMYNTAAAGMFNDVTGSFNVKASGSFNADGPAGANINAGASAAGTPASAGITAAGDASAGVTGNSPIAANRAGRAGRMPTIILPRVLPGSIHPVPFETIVPRVPQHEPWPHHENLNPLEFRPEKTDREQPGELRWADRVLTPDTFRKNKSVGGVSSSTAVTGSGGGIAGPSGGSSGAAYNSSYGSTTPTGPANGTETGSVTYVAGFAGKTRNKPIQDKLLSILDSAAKAAKVSVIITSGGQDAPGPGARRTGSQRHDGGYAADVQIFNGNSRALNVSNSNDLGIWITFIKAAKQAGATAVGAGNGYMGNDVVHLDIAYGRPGVPDATYWGGPNTRSADAPAWLVNIMSGSSPAIS